MYCANNNYDSAAIDNANHVVAAFSRAFIHNVSIGAWDCIYIPAIKPEFSLCRTVYTSLEKDTKVSPDSSITIWTI
jgi:hypothetical protein